MTSRAINQQKGPASAPTLPSHGPTNSREGLEMNKHSNTTAAAETTMPVDDRDLGDAHTIIHRARHLNELLFMAGESLQDRTARNAFTTGADMIEELLTDAANVIDAVMSRKAGAA